MRYADPEMQVLKASRMIVRSMSIGSGSCWVRHFMVYDFQDVRLKVMGSGVSSCIPGSCRQRLGRTLPKFRRSRVRAEEEATCVAILLRTIA